MTVDKTFQEFLQQAYSEEYKSMKCELMESNMLNHEIFGIQFTVGNRHELVANPKQANSNKNEKNRHKWTCFIELNHPMLKKYTYKLINKVDF